MTAAAASAMRASVSRVRLLRAPLGLPCPLVRVFPPKVAIAHHVIFYAESSKGWGNYALGRGLNLLPLTTMAHEYVGDYDVTWSSLLN